MTKKTVVVVSDPDDSAHGEISILENPESAAYFVETMLESGLDRDRIRVFAAEELEMRVTHRPVVAFATGETEEESGEEDEEERGLTDGAGLSAEQAMPNMASSVVGVDAGPYTRNGVRFSSLFRPA